MTSSRDDEFEAFVRRRRGALVRSATILTAGDAHGAEDLVQQALVRLYLAWPRARATNIDAYASRVLVNGLIDERRRPFSRRERAVHHVPERAVAEPRSDGLDPALLRALQTLPVSMRKAVVLRHVEGMTVDETAAAMNCSTGNVKSQTSRGLDKLRDLVGASAPPTPSPANEGAPR